MYQGNCRWKDLSYLKLRTKVRRRQAWKSPFEGLSSHLGAALKTAQSYPSPLQLPKFVQRVQLHLIMFEEPGRIILLKQSAVTKSRLSPSCSVRYHPWHSIFEILQMLGGWIHIWKQSRDKPKSTAWFSLLIPYSTVKSLYRYSPQGTD